VNAAVSIENTALQELATLSNQQPECHGDEAVQPSRTPERPQKHASARDLRALTDENLSVS